MDVIISFLIILLCYIFCFSNGFNDAANIIALPIATRVISPSLALAVACVFEFVGCYFLGDLVFKTIVKDVIELNFLKVSNISYVIFSALFAACGWVLACTIFGFPISSSHTLIGSMIGSVLSINFYAVKWVSVLRVILVLIFAPFIGFVVAYLFTKIIYIMCSNAYKEINKFFKFLNVVSICFFALSHGANNGKKGVGLLMFCLIALNFYEIEFNIPKWALLSCACFISCGILLGGKRVIKTIGMKIYKIKHWQAAVSQLTAAGLTYLGTLFGFPLSTTHLIVGSITGSGSAERVKSVKWDVSLDIFIIWILTLPFNI
ncbi:MAG: inorganic phosphate transporter, partial [Endomicrobia bacterium]|nr:inorganic phosphate transporter [Endomicrobiia bacterium]